MSVYVKDENGKLIRMSSDGKNKNIITFSGEAAVLNEWLQIYELHFDGNEFPIDDYREKSNKDLIKMIQNSVRHDEIVVAR